MNLKTLRECMEELYTIALLYHSGSTKDLTHFYDIVEEADDIIFRNELGNPAFLVTRYPKFVTNLILTFQDGIAYNNIQSRNKDIMIIDGKQFDVHDPSQIAQTQLFSSRMSRCARDLGKEFVGGF